MDKQKKSTIISVPPAQMTGNKNKKQVDKISAEELKRIMQVKFRGA
jgi:hypothetical protein